MKKIQLLSLSVTLGGLFLTSTSQAALLARYLFDEPSGTSALDSSGNNHHGTLVNAPVRASDATRSSYLSFNGTTQSVDTFSPSAVLGSSNGAFLPLFTTTQNFTWAYWANSQAVISATQQNSVIIGNRYAGANSTDASPREFIKFTPSQFEYRLNDTGAAYNYADLAVGEWHHYAVVKTGTSFQFYLDGAASGAATTITNVNSNQLPFFIGGNTGATNVNEFFTGFVDDVHLFDDAQSAAQIAALAVPEPSGVVLIALSSGLLAFRRRR